MPLWREMDSRKRVSMERLRGGKMTTTLKSCPFEEPVGKYEIENDKPMMTNEEWFDTLSTEGKAKWLDGLIAYCFGIGHITESEQKKYQKIVADVELWLKQPHTTRS